jgi:hypothetical protein
LHTRLLCEALDADAPRVPHTLLTAPTRVKRILCPECSLFHEVMPLHTGPESGLARGRLGPGGSGPAGKRGTEDHEKRVGASTPSRITSSNVETTARANASSATPSMWRSSSLAAPSCRQGAARPRIAIAQMMQSHRNLDQPCKVSRSRPPHAASTVPAIHGLRNRAPVEQERGLPESDVEGASAASSGRAPRRGDALAPPAPRAPPRAVPRSRRGERGELRAAPHGRGRPRGQLRDPVSQRQRQRHGRRSTRVPAMRSCRARLSRRSPAIR